MSANLHTLTELGCYVSAGFIDHYDGKKHHRLGQVLLSGDVILSGEGEAYANKLVTGSFMAALASEAPAVPLGVVMANDTPSRPGLQRVDEA